MEQMGTGKLTLLLPREDPQMLCVPGDAVHSHSSHWSLRGCYSHVEPTAALFTTPKSPRVCFDDLISVLFQCWVNFLLRHEEKRAKIFF